MVILGDDFDNVIFGTDSRDSIDGKGGNDIINGMGSSDTLIGGTGDDIYEFSGVFSGQFSSEEIVESANSGNDTLHFLNDIPKSSIRLMGGAPNLPNTLMIYADGYGSIFLSDHLLEPTVEWLQIGSDTPVSLIGGLTMTGSANRDSFYGTKFNDIINGMGSSDTLIGGTGDDIYEFSGVFSGQFSSEEIVESANSGNDTLHFLNDIPKSSIRLMGGAPNLPNTLMIYADGYGSIFLSDHLLEPTVEWLQIGSDTPISLSGGLTMTGSANSETIYGTKFNDIINGKGGTNTLNGGAGIDTAIYDEMKENYTLSAFDISGTFINGNGTRDTLKNIERIKFSDLGIAFDLDGNAGVVARILGAVFGRDAINKEDYVGIGLNLLDKGTNHSDLMKLALNARLGNGFTNAAEIELLYQNLLGISPTANDIDRWTTSIASGQFTQVSLAEMAADTAFNSTNINLTGLIQTGIEYI